MRGNCSSSCSTPGAHATFGECMRAKNLRLSDTSSVDYKRGHAWFQSIKEYKDARAQGIQPRSSQLADVRQAVSLSNQLGSAVDMT